MHPFKPLLDFFEQIPSFFLIWVILGAFWPKKGPKNSQRGQKNWYYFFWLFNSYMHPFKSLLAFFEQILMFSLIWVILEVFGGFGGPEKRVWLHLRLWQQADSCSAGPNTPYYVLRFLSSSDIRGVNLATRLSVKSEMYVFYWNFLTDWNKSSHFGLISH